MYAILYEHRSSGSWDTGFDGHTNLRIYYIDSVILQKYSLQKMIGLKISKVENNLPQRTRNTAERDVALFWQYIFFNCFLSLFSSHLFRKSSSRCYIFHLSSPHQVAFLKRTINKYGKTDWICIFFYFDELWDWFWWFLWSDYTLALFGDCLS